MKEDWQDKESKSRLEKCRGCDSLHKRNQSRGWEDDNVTRRDTQKIVQHWWCCDYGLHLEFIDRILGCGYSEDGIDKECPRYRN